MLLSTRGGVLSTEAVRLVRPVRSGGPGFVPLLFPRRRSPPSPRRWLTRATRNGEQHHHGLAWRASSCGYRDRGRSTRYDRTCLMSGCVLPAQSDAPGRAPPRVQKGGCSRWGHGLCKNAQHVRGRRGSVRLVLCAGHRPYQLQEVEGSRSSNQWHLLGLSPSRYASPGASAAPELPQHRDRGPPTHHVRLPGQFAQGSLR